MFKVNSISIKKIKKKEKRKRMAPNRNSIIVFVNFLYNIKNKTQIIQCKNVNKFIMGYLPLL